MLAALDSILLLSCFFFFNDTATTEIYTLSLHDALPISPCAGPRGPPPSPGAAGGAGRRTPRSEEHTSELQSRGHLVCRLLLEKKKNHKQSKSRPSTEYPPHTRARPTASSYHPPTLLFSC